MHALLSSMQTDRCSDTVAFWAGQKGGKNSPGGQSNCEASALLFVHQSTNRQKRGVQVRGDPKIKIIRRFLFHIDPRRRSEPASGASQALGGIRRACLSFGGLLVGSKGKPPHFRVFPQTVHPLRVLMRSKGPVLDRGAHPGRKHVAWYLPPNRDDV